MEISAQEKQYRRMTETPVSKLIITLGIPTVISMLVTNIYNIADTYFVGTLGTSASGVTGIVFGLMAILQAFGFMFGHGAGSNIARQLGNRNLDGAREFAATSFWLSIAAGLVIMGIGFVFMDPLMRLLGSTETILPYARTYAYFILIAGPAMTSSCVMNNILRYEGKAFYAMIGLTSGGILNMAGDAILIRGMHMGIAGAGLSTAISQYIAMVILMLPYLQKKTQSSLNIAHFTHHFSTVTNIVTVGMPSLARQGLGSISTMVLNGCAGNYGDAAVAAISIVSRISNFLFCVATGIGQGFQPVSSFNYGAGKYSRVRDGFRFAMILGTSLMLVFAIVTYIHAETFVAFFRDDPEVTVIGLTAMRAMCLALALTPTTTYGNMLFQSIGKSGRATFLATLRSGLVLIPMVILLTNAIGLFGLEISQAMAEAVSALITIPIVLQFMRTLPKDA